jgi:hypothetical protein
MKVLKQFDKNHAKKNASSLSQWKTHFSVSSLFLKITVSEGYLGAASNRNIEILFQIIRFPSRFC